MSNKVKISREMIRRVVEVAASTSFEEYVKDVFHQQHPGYIMEHVDANFRVINVECTRLSIPGFEVTWED